MKRNKILILFLFDFDFDIKTEGKFMGLRTYVYKYHIISIESKSNIFVLVTEEIDLLIFFRCFLLSPIIFS